MRTFIKTCLAMAVCGILFACDGGSAYDPVAEKNKQDVAALSNQLTDLEKVVDDLKATIDMLKQELAAMGSNSAAAQSVKELIEQLTAKQENVEEFMADVQSKIEAGEITSITDEVAQGLDAVITDVLEVGEAVGELDVEFSNPALNEKLESLQESLDSWVEDADKAAHGFGQPEKEDSSTSQKVKKVKKIQTKDEYYDYTMTVAFEYDAAGRITRLKESWNEGGYSGDYQYVFDYNTLRKIYIADEDGYEYALTLDSKDRVTKLVYAKDDIYTYAYDSDGNLKYIHDDMIDASVRFDFSYMNGALKAMAYDIDYGSDYQSSSTLDASSWFSHKYPSNTINMDLNLYLLGLDADSFCYFGPNYGKVGDYFIEVCLSPYAGEIPMDPGMPGDWTDDPNYYETETRTWSQVEQEGDTLPLTYTFDSDKCPTQVKASVTVQLYEYTITRTAGQVVEQFEDGTTYYEVVTTTSNPVPVGNPETCNRITDITYYAG